MIAIIKYNAGNIASVQNALDRLGYCSVVTNNETDIINAEKVIFPGVGEASSAMKYLRENDLVRVILSIKSPFLGICLGLQLMCEYSEEGNTECLGIFKSIVREFPKKGIVPHMGWNNITQCKSDLFKGITITDSFYFVHKFYAEINEQTIASCNYIRPFSAAMQKENFFATQFHPEKSSTVGEQILKNFLSL